MDRDKSETETTEQPKKTEQPISDIVGDLVVSAATVIAHSAAEAVVGRVKKAAKKSAVAKKAKAVVKKVAPKANNRRSKKTKSSAGRKAVRKTKTAKKLAKKSKR
jgi:hypothetical protein